MFKNQVEKVFTVLLGGPSGVGKTYIFTILVDEDYSDGVGQFTGPGSTSNYQSEAEIDPSRDTAQIQLELHEFNDVKEFVLKELVPALVSESKNVIASLPVDDEIAFTNNLKKAIIKRSVFSKAFKVHRLLVTKASLFHEILEGIFRLVLEKANEDVFKKSYKDTAKESKDEATRLVEELVISSLEEKELMIQVDELAKLIIQESKSLLISRGFTENENGELVVEGLSGDAFSRLTVNLTNSDDKKYIGIPSAACIIKFMTFSVPGKGIKNPDGEIVGYKLIDIVGFDNDGYTNIEKRIKEATLTKYSYDAIMYFASYKKNIVDHEDFLTDIFNSMRPAKLIILSTFMDKHSVFEIGDDDEYPDMSQLLELNNARRKEIMNVVQKTVQADVNVIPPTFEDIICTAKGISYRRHGQAAKELYSDSQHELIISALERAYVEVRRRISIGVPRNSEYLIPNNSVLQYTAQVIHDIYEEIDREYIEMRGNALSIHHWTLDAILWHLAYKRQHSSHAIVWKNVTVQTFTNMEEVIWNTFNELKFSPEVKISNKEDVERVRNDVLSNFRTGLYYLVRELVLSNQGDGSDSKYKDEILNLYRKPKYNKWKIIDDLRLNLKNAVSQKDYLEKLIENALRDAMNQTYDRLLY